MTDFQVIPAAIDTNVVVVEVRKAEEGWLVVDIEYEAPLIGWKIYDDGTAEPMSPIGGLGGMMSRMLMAEAWVTNVRGDNLVATEMGPEMMCNGRAALGHIIAQKIIRELNYGRHGPEIGDKIAVNTAGYQVEYDIQFVDRKYRAVKRRTE